MGYLDAIKITRKFSGGKGIRELSFDVEKGDWVGVIGPTGCGKTTLLKVLAGIESSDSGQIVLNGKDISKWPSRRRSIVLMWQDLALFEELSAEQNIRFGAPSGKDLREVFSLFQIDDMILKKRAKNLSGGEKQRVALARAYAAQPHVLLLDEPFGQQDAHKKESMVHQLLRLKQNADKPTVLLVSHDQNEVFAIADWVLVLSDGRIAGTGKPEDLIKEPQSKEVAELVGDNNIFPCYLAENKIYLTVGEQNVELSSKPQAGLGGQFYAILPATRLRLAPPIDCACKQFQVSDPVVSFRASYSICLHYNAGNQRVHLNCDVDDFKKTSRTSQTTLFFREGDLRFVREETQL